MLSLDSVAKLFAGGRGRAPVTALDDVSLTVEPGELITVIGPSGSGKSTLLFVLGAMMTPTRGTVRLDGRDVYTLSSSRRAGLRRNAVGFVFQTFNLVPYLSCLENVSLPALLDGHRRSEARRRAAEMLERVGLDDRFGHLPSELSVGERQRVALCRSLVNQPTLLLADEPTGNLDPEMTEQVMTLLLDLNAQGQTIVLVSHDHRLAERGQRVIQLRDGRIEEDRPSRAAEAAS